MLFRKSGDLRYVGMDAVSYLALRPRRNPSLPQGRGSWLCGGSASRPRDVCAINGYGVGTRRVTLLVTAPNHATYKADASLGLSTGGGVFYLTSHAKARFGVILPVVKYGNDVLRQKAVPVAEVTDEIKKLVSDMLESMYAAKGVGLAAEQIGRTECICVIDVPADMEKEACREENAAIAMPLVLINPEITATEGKQRNEEGCLSFPDIGAPISRADKVTVAYTDIHGKRQTATARGLLSRAIQHETDHLNGVLLVDRMSAMQKMSVSGQLKRLLKAAQA